MVVDRVAALDTAGSLMDSVAVERDRALAFPAVAHRFTFGEGRAVG